jgi:hypothetical protein
MQPLSWYAKRLKSMSAPEVAWRAKGKMRDVADRISYKNRLHVPSVDEVVNGCGRANVIDASLFGEHFPGINAESLAVVPKVDRDALVAEADRVKAHRLRLFDMEDVDLGDPIRWNYEFKAGVATPMEFAPDIDYRDHAVVGDCKFAWEPSRHHQFVTLGRAYRLTGDESYAIAMVEQLESWIDQCPFGVGMQWRSPLELGIRLINWVWALELIRPAGVLTDAQWDRIYGVAHRHIWDIARKYSKYSSANNHLIGEAAGVYVGACYFAGFKGASSWRAEAKAILEREILDQTHPDGGNREQAYGYHLFVTQFYLFAGLAGRHRGEDFSQGYWRRLEKMFDFVRVFQEGGANSPNFGDADDGIVLDLGGRSAARLLGMGAVLFDRGDLRRVSDGFHEPVVWIVGDSGQSYFEKESSSAANADRLASTALESTGYYLLQSGEIGDSGSASVIFDCGPLGFGAIAAHGHADALSVLLRIGGVEVLIDPGTYDYFTYPEWRQYFRGTSAHNTVMVDGLDQSEMQGLFLWGRRAESVCENWSPSEDGGQVVGSHDGYLRLSDPVGHRRSVRLDGSERQLVVTDDLTSDNHHEFTLRWHFAPHCVLKSTDEENVFILEFPGGCGTIEVGGELVSEVVCGAASPSMGWRSEGYHRKTVSPTLVSRMRARGNRSISTRISWRSIS